MLTVIQSESRTSTSFDKWNLWRVTNSAILFCSFFAPWILYTDMGDYKATGFRFLGFVQYMAKFEIFVQEREFSERVRFALGLGQLTIDLYAILIYCALGLLLITFGHKFAKKPIWINSLLGLILIMLGARSLWEIPFSFISNGWHGLSFMLWGYWLVLSGLVSSVVFEISYFMSKRT